MSKLPSPFSLIVILGCALMSFKAMASPSPKIHLLENLSSTEVKLVQKWIESKGYRLSKAPLFHESKDALIVTKTLANEIEPASIQIDIMRHEQDHSVPKAVFQIKLETQDLSEVLDRIPSPAKINSIPVAYQNQPSQRN